MVGSLALLLLNELFFSLLVLIPLHEVDLIEDIAIAYGYDNFIPEIPEISTIGQEDQKEIVKNKKNGILIPKNDEVKLSKAILFLFNNKNIAKKYGLSGFKTIKENFFIKKKVLEYEKIYMNI